MSMKKMNFKPALVVILAIGLFTYACSTKVEENNRSASLLTVESVTGEQANPTGGFTESTPLLSDTCDNDNAQSQLPENCTVFNDNADILFSNDFLQIGGGDGSSPTTSFLNDIIVTQYRVDYFRPNGRNNPGVDVPFGIDGSMNIRIAVNSTGTGSIIIVRHEAKREAPLAELDEGGSEGVLTANAQMKFFGRDLAGRNVTATGFLEIHFANYGESQ
jgi:hypothetical protein